MTPQQLQQKIDNIKTSNGTLEQKKAAIEKLDTDISTNKVLKKIEEEKADIDDINQED